jgi:hypothetical protein
VVSQNSTKRRFAGALAFTLMLFGIAPAQQPFLYAEISQAF